MRMHVRWIVFYRDRDRDTFPGDYLSQESLYDGDYQMYRLITEQ